MLLNISGINIYFEKYLNTSSDQSAGQAAPKDVLLIHGFTGSSNDWQQIIPKLSKKLNYYTVDLIGHGNSDSPSNEKFYEAESLVKIISEFATRIIKEKFFLLGYSMGGRAALSYSIKYPETLYGLILESSSAGIKDQNDKNLRIKKDEELAKFIESHSIEEFITLWMDQDIFNTQKRFANSKLKTIKNSKLNNSKIGLANFLRRFGTGQMPPLYEQLKNIKSKTLLITGDLDEKFSSINNEMAPLFPSAKHIVIKNSGHNTHLETPDYFIKAVNNFLNGF